MPLLNRTCVNEYRIPGTNKIIEKGVEVFIPVLALQRDEKYYPQPDEFKPERFSEESSIGKNQVNRPYHPFGDGPRNCIGVRMGKMQTKVALVLMLQKWKYELEADKMNSDLELDPRAFMMIPKGGVNLRVSKRL